MTGGRKSSRKKVAKQPQQTNQQTNQQQQQQQHQQQQQLQQQQQQRAPLSIQSTSHTVDDSVSSPPSPNIRKEQPPPPQIVRKIAKAESDEASTLKVVFKSNPDAQMKEFIKKAGQKPAQQQAAKVLTKTPADAHSPAVAQELLDTDDDVADNLAKLFKTSKSYKNV